MAVPEALKPALKGLAHRAGGFGPLDKLPTEVIYKMASYPGQVALLFKENGLITIPDFNTAYGYTYFNKDFKELYTVQFIVSRDYTWGLTRPEIAVNAGMGVGDYGFILYTSRENPDNKKVLLVVAV